MPSWAETVQRKRYDWQTKALANGDSRPYKDPAPSWARRAEHTHNLWQSEADRQQQNGGGSSWTTTIDQYNRPIPLPPPPSAYYPNRPGTPQPAPFTYSSSNSYRNEHQQLPMPPPPFKLSHDVPFSAASNTKTSSTGSYLDPEGNRISYTKEVSTGSEPGKEYSLLTEEERRVMEKPLEPGVISRHVTTKYYKKSTFSDSKTTTTTSSGGAPQPAIDYGKTGRQSRPGVSQF
jgi:hypothetical protein